MRTCRAHVRRAGMVLAMTLVALAVLSVVLAVVTSQIVAQRRLAQQRSRQLQADWLARAGIELAAARLLQKAEPFSTDFKDVAPHAKIHVVVEKVGDDTYEIRADAEISADDVRVIHRSASARLRRTDSAGVIRLQVLPTEMKK